MHLRHLIVLIIDARNAGSRSCNRGLGLGLERNLSMPHGMVFDRSDQINQNSRGLAVSRRGAPQTSSEPSLNDVERSGRVHPEGRQRPNLLSVATFLVRIGGADRNRTDDL